MKRSICTLIAVTLWLPWGVSAQQDLLTRQNDDDQWALPSKNYSATRYSTLDEITAENAQNLQQVWSFSTGALRGHEGQPLVVEDTMYVHSAFPNHVYAIDLTQEGWPIKWQYTPTQDARAVAVACCDSVHRGVNYADGKILMATLDGHVLALNAETGEELWNVVNADPTRGETMTMAGLVVKTNYIVGVSGGEFGIRGWVAAYDINSGEQMWKAYSMGPDADLLLAPDFNDANPHYGQTGLGTSTWPGERWRNGGGSTWGWYAYDPDLDLVYYSTGNPGTWNPTVREGDNKWSMSIIARDPDTGLAKWAYQMTPWDAWDYDGINEHVLIDITRGGTTVPALVHFDRNGFVYVLNRTDGSLISAEKFVPSTNWAERIDMETGRPVEVPSMRTRQDVVTEGICPAAMGAKNQQPVSYSPRTQLIYAGTNNLCMNYEGVEVQYIAGAPYVGANVRIFAGPGGHYGEFMAWNPATDSKVWGIEEPFPVWTGTVVTAGDVVFYGTMDGWFKAVNARTGEPLWQHKLSSGSIGNPMTFVAPDGKQYVGIYSGIGGWFGLPVAANLSREDPLGALGAVGAAYDSGLDKVTSVGGTLHVFALP